jgi:hypothetical protein
MELRENGFVGQALASGLGDAEVDHFGDGRAVVDGDENVRGLEVAVNDALLMRVLNRLAHLHKKPEPRFRREPRFIAELGDAHTAHQFHHEVRPARWRRAAIEHLGDVRMVHQRQRLSLRFEAGDDLFGVHAELDDLECHATAHRLFLFGHINDAATALADLLQ